MTQISARLDCVENLTRQRHDRDQTENQQNVATVDSCFELVGSRQHGVARAFGRPLSSPLLFYFLLCYTVLTRANQLETAVHGCRILLILGLVSIMSLSC